MDLSLFLPPLAACLVIVAIHSYLGLHVIAREVIFVDPDAPHRNLELRGTADLTVDEDCSFRDKVGAKYGEDVSVHDKPGDTRYVVTVEPARVRVWPPGA